MSVLELIWFELNLINWYIYSILNRFLIELKKISDKILFCFKRKSFDQNFNNFWIFFFKKIIFQKPVKNVAEKHFHWIYSQNSFNTFEKFKKKTFHFIWKNKITFRRKTSLFFHFKQTFHWIHFIYFTSNSERKRNEIRSIFHLAHDNGQTHSWSRVRFQWSQEIRLKYSKTSDNR